MPLTESDPEIRNAPIYWFCVMERARETGDFQRAMHAKQQLERLGIQVAYHRPEHRKDERGD